MFLSRRQPAFHAAGVEEERQPQAVPTAAALGAECAFDLHLVAPQLPPFDVPAGHDENSWLRELTMRGALIRYGPPAGNPKAYAQIEKELRARGHDVVVGIDEVGRGAWAGPLMVGAAVLPVDRRVNGVRDSKLLTEPGRELLFDRIAAWCTTCHTRYLAPSGSWGTNSGDAVFTYRHTGDNVSGDAASNRNCIQCHVAHGTNAQMPSSSVEWPAGTTPSADSRLLRVDDRGVCVMCHNV